MGDLHIDLPNGLGKMQMVFKNAVHAPEIMFTLISISRLNKAGYSMTFNKGMCTIKTPKDQTIATIPHCNRLYKIAAPKQSNTREIANIASTKISISQAHRKLGHISYSAIKHAITQGFMASIDIDPDLKPDFCEACTKAKSARQPFPKEFKTRAEKFGEWVHWYLWGPASVKSLNENSYVAAHIDNTTCESKLYFQEKKSQTFESYKVDEAYIETQTGHHIKALHSD